MVMTNVAIESGPVEIVDLPIDSMVIFHSYVNVYQRVVTKYNQITKSYSWLVVEPPPRKMMEFVSWDDDIPK